MNGIGSDFTDDEQSSVRDLAAGPTGSRDSDETRYDWLEAMVDHIPDFIFAKDLNGRFLFGNRSLVKNNGLRDVQELIGKTDFDFLPEEAAMNIAAIEQSVMDTGQPDIGFEELAELGNRDRWLMMSRVPLRDKSGKIIGVVGASRDITARKSAERLTLAQAHLLEIIARGTPLPSFMDQLIGIIAEFKPGVFPALFLVDEISGKLALAANGLNEHYRKLIVSSRLGSDRYDTQIVNTAEMLLQTFRDAQVTTAQYSLQCLPIHGSQGEPQGILAVYVPSDTDFSGFDGFLKIAVNMAAIAIAKHLADTRITFLAQHDTLTGLANRTLFDQDLTIAVSNAEAKGTGMSLAFLDLDNFKLVNDSMGHAVGDRLLKVIASRISAASANQGIVSRIGGDEFVILIREANAQVTETCLRRIQNALAAPVMLDGVDVQITCSIGLASFPAHGRSASELLVSADVAMYRAKQIGRNCIQIFDPSMSAGVKEKLSRKEELRLAIAKNQLVLHFQPQQDRASGQIVGVEALVRWNHPTDGLVYPGDFIPLAEDTGLIVSIGEWVAREACRVAKQWQNQNLPPIRIGINVSPRQFQEKMLVETVAAVIADSGLSPEFLELEVTESMIMRDPEASIAKMIELRNLGLSLAVDDFGTGYSSLSALKRFPITRLKIDRSFVKDIPSDTDDMAITSAIISLAQKLGLEVIAEGVETEEQAQFLISSGCTEIQGYLFSRPVPEAEFARILRANLAPIADTTRSYRAA